VSKSLADQPSTLVRSLKDKYIVRQQYDKLGQKKFLPSNFQEAKNSIMTEQPFDLGRSDELFRDDIQAD
jgi:hypothetical protein